MRTRVRGSFLQSSADGSAKTPAFDPLGGRLSTSPCRSSPTTRVNLIRSRRAGSSVDRQVTPDMRLFQGSANPKAEGGSMVSWELSSSLRSLHTPSFSRYNVGREPL